MKMHIIVLIFKVQAMHQSKKRGHVHVSGNVTLYIDKSLNCKVRLDFKK